MSARFMLGPFFLKKQVFFCIFRVSGGLGAVLGKIAVFEGVKKAVFAKIRENTYILKNGLFWASWGLLGASWRALGGQKNVKNRGNLAFFVFWAVLGPSWAVLGPSWAVFGPLLAVLGRFLASGCPFLLKCSACYGCFWASSGCLGPFFLLRLSWAVLGCLGASSGQTKQANPRHNRQNKSSLPD